jgi:hypothetical protein
MDANDDGKVIDGKTIVWMGRMTEADMRPTPAERRVAKVAAANAAAASLEMAARDGIPFCEECEAARKGAQVVS